MKAVSRLASAHSRNSGDRFRMVSVAGFAALITVGGSTLGAQAPSTPTADNADTIRISLADARLRARQANPTLVAARLDTTIARGRLRQSRLLRFNPSADVLTETSGDNLEAGLSQEIEIFGQRRARIAAGRAGYERAAFSVADATRLVIGDVDRTFYRLASATERAKLAHEVRLVNERLADVAKRQLAEGEISRLDYNLAVIEHGRARARSLATRRDRDQAEIELGLLIGLSRDTRISTLLDNVSLVPGRDSLDPLSRFRWTTDSVATPDLDGLMAMAFARRPDLEERAAAVRQSRSEATLAAREALPNPVLRGVVEQPTRGGERTIRPGIGITLPFLNRNQGERAALRAATAQAELERAGVATRVRAEITSAAAAYAAAATEVRILESTMLAPARQNRQLVEIAYREGEVGLPVLLLIQNQAIDAELDYWAAWLAAREALANLAQATGVNVDATGVTGSR